MNRQDDIHRLGLTMHRDAARPLARHDDQPVFAEPWQAEVLVIAEHLVERGVLEAGAWAVELGAALEDEPERPDPREHYFRAVLRALERLMVDAGGVTPEALDERTGAWRRAYGRTPHGQPVELARGLDHDP